MLYACVYTHMSARSDEWPPTDVRADEWPPTDVRADECPPTDEWPPMLCARVCVRGYHICTHVHTHAHTRDTIALL